MKQIVLLTFVSLHTLVVSAVGYTESVNGVTWHYINSDGKAEICNGSSPAIDTSITGAVTIPSELGGYPVVSIGANAFKNCSLMTSVTIPSCVTNIGYRAFYNCCGLTSVVVPNSVTHIGPGAFSGCECLTHVALPFVGSERGNTGTIESLFGYVFGTNYEDGEVATTQWYSSSLSVTFYIPSSLRSVAITDETELGYGAFYGCTGLRSLTIPDGLTVIGDCAFCGCNGLASLTIPDSVIAIGSAVFPGCNGLSSFGVDKNNQFYRSESGLLLTKDGKTLMAVIGGLSHVTVPDGVMTIGRSAFAGNTNLMSVTIPSSVTSIGKAAFGNCSGLTDVTIPGSVTNIGQSAFGGCGGLTRVTIPENVMRIEDFAFYDCAGLMDVMISTGVVEIGARAFANCIGLSNVTIPDSVKSIGEYAFYKCSGLTSVTIGAGVTSIGSAAFFGCNSLTTVNVLDLAAWCRISFLGVNPLNFAHKLCLNGEPLVDLIIPNGVTNIGAYAFQMCSGITSVTIPESVVSIGTSAFARCSNLMDATIPDSVTSVGLGAFAGCIALTNLTIGSGVTSIGESAFSGCSGLTSVTIPDSVMNIAPCAFYTCSNLTHVAIGSSVTNIGWFAFRYCDKLTNVRISDSVMSIGDHAFSDCNASLYDMATIQGVVLVDGWAIDHTDALPASLELTGVRGVGGQAFSSCYGLTSVIFGDNISGIGFEAFRGCTNLTSVVMSDNVKCIEDGAFARCKRLKKITIGSGVTRIGDYAFSECSGLVSITICNGVTSIGSYAFANCGMLTSMTIPDSVISIGSYAFSGCTGLGRATIPDGVTRIEDGMFYGCSDLTSVFIPDGVARIGSYAFSGCSSLSGVTIPDSVASVGRGAFSGCKSALYDTTSIAGVKLVDGWAIGYTGDISGHLDLTGVRGIGYIAFQKCANLTSVTIPNSVTNIESDLFFGCSGLSSVLIPGSVIAIGPNAFANCGGLIDVTFQGQLPVGVSQSHILTYATSVRYPRKYSEMYATVVSASKFAGYVYCGLDDWVDLYGYDISTSLDGGWHGDATDSHDGYGSLRSETIANNQSAWIETTVYGPGRLAFWWKASSEEYDGDVFDYAFLSVDGVPQGRLDNSKLMGVAIGGKTDWTNIVFDVTGDGAHVIRWTYRKDEIDEVDVGYDCIWLDEITFSPRVTLTFQVDELAAGDAPNFSVHAFAGSVIELPLDSEISWIDHVIKSWNDGTSDYMPGEIFTVPSSNITLTAHWIAKSLIAFNLNGGSGDGLETIKAFPDEIVSLPTGRGLSLVDHELGGWTDGAKNYSPGSDYTVPASNATLTAVWIAKSILTFSLDGGSGEVPIAIKDVPSSVVALPLSDGIAKLNHTFVGWSDGIQTYEAGAEYVVTDANVEFAAVWAANMLDAPTITSADVATGGTVDMAFVTIEILAADGTAIYYTVDGTEPTTNSTRYAGRFVADGMAVTVRAMATKNNYFDSPIAEFSFTRIPYSASECLNVCGKTVITGDEDASWVRVLGETTHDGTAALRSGVIGEGESSTVKMSVKGSGEIGFWWKTSCERAVRGNPKDHVSFFVDDVEQCWLGGITDWSNVVVSVSGDGDHVLKWIYLNNGNAITAGDDCAWLDEVIWTPSGAADGVAIQVNGAAVEFETAADGKTRTAEVSAGTAAEDVKVFVGGVDVTAGFKVAVEGTTATVVLKEPYETADATSATLLWTDNGDGSVTLNVEVVPGLYYAADSAATIEALRRPGAAESAKAGDAVVAPKQEGAQGFYKVWVSDAPIEAE